MNRHQMFDRYIDNALADCMDLEISVLSRLTNNQVRRVVEFCSFSSLRVFLAEALANDSGDHRALVHLLKLSKDRHWLVRCCAIDSLAEFTSRQVLERALAMAKKEKHSIVRAYAIDTATRLLAVMPELTDICTEFVNVLIELTECDNVRLRIQASESLYKLGKLPFAEMAALRPKNFEKADYSEQCFILHSLDECTEPALAPIILNFLQKIEHMCKDSPVCQLLAELTLKCSSEG